MVGRRRAAARARVRACRGPAARERREERLQVRPPRAPAAPRELRRAPLRTRTRRGTSTGVTRCLPGTPFTMAPWWLEVLCCSLEGASGQALIMCMGPDGDVRYEKKRQVTYHLVLHANCAARLQKANPVLLLDPPRDAAFLPARALLCAELQPRQCLNPCRPGSTKWVATLCPTLTFQSRVQGRGVKARRPLLDYQHQPACPAFMSALGWGKCFV